MMPESMSYKYRVKTEKIVCIEKKNISSVTHLGLIAKDIRETCYVTKRKKIIIIFQKIWKVDLTVDAQGLLGGSVN